MANPEVSKELRVQDLKQHKKNLERDLTRVISLFEEATGEKVKTVEWSRGVFHSVEGSKEYGAHQFVVDMDL